MNNPFQKPRWALTPARMAGLLFVGTIAVRVLVAAGARLLAVVP